MPINVPDKLPAIKTLEGESIFVMTQTRAMSQDIRPQRIVILNIMPVKITTETHILRMLSNTPLQIEVELLHPKSHTSKNTPSDHLDSFYKTFDEVRDNKYDGMIITGAPVEQLNFEEVTYWQELTEILEWSKTHVTSTLFICWAAQAALYHFYGIPKYPLNKKMFGIFYHDVKDRSVPIVRGFDDLYLAPHSRHTEIRAADVNKVDDLILLSESLEAGVYLVASKDARHIFVTGHSEYDPLTLHEEYIRDKTKGLEIDIPKHYYPENDPTRQPFMRWRSHGNLLFTNWLNYYVYQETPFDLGNQ